MTNIKLNFLISLIFLSFSFSTLSAIEGVYNAPKVDNPPVIDGMGTDDCWQKASWAPIANVWIGSAVSSADYSGKFKVVWTPERLYVLVEVVDDSLSCQKVFDINNIYNYDCVEVFIDENRSRGTYSGTYQAFAYHTDTTGHICYARGNYGWERLDDHINMKVKKVAAHTYNWEFEIKIFDDSYASNKTNIPVSLTVGKSMGWSVAYNDNDAGTARQSMFGSKYIDGTDKNISYFNSSAFGDINLVFPADTGTTILHTGVVIRPESNSLECFVLNNENKVRLTFNNSTTGIYQIQVFDITGKMVASKEMLKTQQVQDENIDAASLHPGIYLVRATGAGKVYTSKVISSSGTRLDL